MKTTIKYKDKKQLTKVKKQNARVYRIICVKFENKPSYDKIKMS